MIWFDEEIRIDRDISDQLVKLSMIFKLNIIISAVNKLHYHFIDSRLFIFNLKCVFGLGLTLIIFNFIMQQQQ